jgi:hypothetical protein
LNGPKDERSKSEELSRGRKAGQAMALRACVVLACAEGPNNSEVAKELKICFSLGSIANRITLEVEFQAAKKSY